MKPLAKGLLIGCGSIVVLGIVGVVAVALYVRAHGGEWMAQGEAMQAEGAKAGAALADTQCEAQALGNYAKDPGISGAISARVWMAGCFGAARATTELCTGVPPESEILRSAGWRVSRCETHGLGNDSNCANILAEVQKQCAARAAQAPPAG